MVEYTNKADALNALKKDGRELEFVSETLRNDKDVVMAALKSPYFYDCPLKWAGQDMKNDKDVILLAIKQSRMGDALAYASQEMRNNKEIAIEALKKDFTSCVWIGDKLKDDKDIKATIYSGYKQSKKSKLKSLDEQLSNMLTVETAKAKEYINSLEKVEKQNQTR